jgi:hypothetical protein
MVDLPTERAGKGDVDPDHACQAKREDEAFGAFVWAAFRR